MLNSKKLMSEYFQAVCLLSEVELIVVRKNLKILIRLLRTQY